jgi:hypothetical protein
MTINDNQTMIFRVASFTVFWIGYAAFLILVFKKMSKPTELEIENAIADRLLRLRKLAYPNKVQEGYCDY